MKIEVKQKDIARGIRQSVVGCPIARAILRDVLHIQQRAWRNVPSTGRERVLWVNSSRVFFGFRSLLQSAPGSPPVYRFF